MIQIQDDLINQGVTQNSQAVASAPPVPSADPVFSPQPTNFNQNSTSEDKTEDNVKDNTAEIDNLLAELDKLSKNLEEKPSTQPETVNQTSSVADPAKSDEKPAEKFDFDSFLTDLETKIDVEGKKNQLNQPIEDQKADQTMTDSADFRKNRSSVDVQSNEEEELKAQNIFDILGLMSITDDEKNQFLDELEAMIWDDFVVHDLELLLTSEEYAGARKILDDKVQKDDEKKENLIIYLEKLVPDLDEVLYDKALELKSEMMGERLSKMKENADEAALSKIKEVENLISQNLWKSAATLLNQL